MMRSWVHDLRAFAEAISSLGRAAYQKYRTPKLKEFAV
jgi:hypothetical protein